MEQDYNEHWEDYNKAHENVKKFEETENVVAKAKVAANPETMAKHKETLDNIRNLLEKMRATEAAVAAEAQKFADQRNPGNTRMFLDAYTEYFDYLSENLSTEKELEQALYTEQQLKSLCVLLESEKLKTEVERQPLPEDIKTQLSEGDKQQFDNLYVEAVTQEVAKLNDMVPGGKFSPEQVASFQRQAFDKLQNTKQNSGTAGADLPDATRKITANPGWTGFSKPKRPRVAGRNYPN